MDTTHLRFGSGQSVRRLEDEQLLRGHGQYADDVVLNAQSRLAFLRSPYPHANIRSIDTTAAQAMPGVHLVLTGAQWRAAGLKDMPPLANFVRPDGKPAATAARCPLAFGRVRFVGEPVVAIVADTEQQAKDAAEAVVVDYEELPCAVTLQDALAPNAPLLSDAPDNRSAETRYGDAASVDKAFASAKHVVKLDIDNQRVAALSIEPRSVLAYVDQGRLTIRMSSQMPTGVRTVVSTLLGLPAEQVRVVIGDVGGGFGMKTGAYAEDV
ncbi:MAG: xanthine dehydrogenase family protein molybdopterin-binding subunit, partial [Limnohabitans sp.]